MTASEEKWRPFNFFQLGQAKNLAAPQYKAKSELRNIHAMTFTINPQTENVKTNISPVNLSKKAEGLL